LIYQAPAFAWALAIFVGSSIPADDLPTVILLAPDKLLHMGVFLVFGILLHRAVVFQKKFSFLLEHPLAATIVIAGGYGLFDEIHQSFVPGRSLDPFDVLADVVGVCLGLWIRRFYQNKWSKWKNRFHVEEQVRGPRPP